jgi:predicted P-loop ATPase
LTRREEAYRPSYGRKEVKEPRQVVFIGTTNKSVYLRDETGGRRFWPVVVDDVALDLLKQDRDQLFAEAVVRYRRGERWWPTPEFEQKYIEPEQEARYEADAWEELIEDYLYRQKPARITVAQIARDVLEIEVPKLGNMEQRRIMAVLGRLHWKRGKRSGSARWWVQMTQ